MLGVNIPALPASLRRTNQRTVISLLLRLGQASRADLAKAAGISQPTAGKITTELLDLGILQEAGSSSAESNLSSSPRLGRPGQLLRLDNEHRRFLAIELGVSETCVAVLPVAVKWEDEWTRTFPTPSRAKALVKDLISTAAPLIDSGLWGVLISVPGIVDEARGRILFCPNLHWLEKLDLPGLLQPAFNVPVLLAQEIRALALGHLTAEPIGEDFFLVDFGQGVGGAIVLDGRLYSHPMPISGEFGHTPVTGNERRCGCGAVGCLETLVSQPGLLQSFRETHQVQNATWQALVEHVERQGLEPWLVGSLNSAAKVIAGALNVLGIHRVVVTGVLTQLPGFVVEHLAEEIRNGSIWGRFGEVICQAAPHRRAAGLVASGINRLVLPEDEEGGLLEAAAKRRQRAMKSSRHALV
jgi:predicted NBD/HSP70 family sugar kinase